MEAPYLGFKNPLQYGFVFCSRAPARHPESLKSAMPHKSFRRHDFLWAGRADYGFTVHDHGSVLL
jgi:hypothetical protein